ncbi:MAG: MFS transporter [Bacteroidota bacterium]
MKRHILPTIIIAQFCCTSLWFAGNGVMDDLRQTFMLPEAALSNLTAAVQFGFICGTLTFALLTIADRFSPSKVFFWCALAGALFNLGVLWPGNTLISLIGFRAMTGFALAGIYPIGMKIAADYYQKGLDKSLGFLVGALVLGTAFPHLVKGFTGDLPWRLVLLVTSGIAVLGGLAMLLLVPDGPFRKPGLPTDLKLVSGIFRNQSFRSAAFGYFGHMWELYAFWAFAPTVLSYFSQAFAENSLSVPLWSFVVIGVGSIACVVGGYLSAIRGPRYMATVFLSLSGICCLFSPFVYLLGSPILFLIFLVFWGLVVIADSPLFSTMVARSADPELKGTALTITNCIGFAITIVSIQLLGRLEQMIPPAYLFLVLAIGPAFGLWALHRIRPAESA